MRRFVIGAFLCLFGCGDVPTDHPLDVQQKGITALTWGLDTSAAMAHMLEMEGVTFERETTYAFMAGGLVSWHTPDTVQVRPGEFDSVTTVVHRYAGGTFTGIGVERWILVFERMNELGEVRIILADTEERLRRKYLQTMAHFEKRYTRRDGRTPPYLEFLSAGIAGFDTTRPADTYVSGTSWHNGSRREGFLYKSKAVTDSSFAWWNDHPIVRMHVDDYEAMQESSR